MTGLAGCGIRLEDDAPTVPLIPRRTPLLAEDQLLALLTNSRDLAAACDAWTLGDGPRLAPALQQVHESQAQVLAAMLAQAKVPADRLAATTTTPPTTSGQGSPTSPSAPATIQDVAALERRPLADLVRLAGCAPSLRPAVVAVLAQRYAAARVLGGIAPPLPASVPAHWPSQSDARAVLAATRSATYGFQVVAAQGDAAGRALGMSTLSELAALTVAQTATLTGAPPPAVIGYDLPFAVTTPKLARTLALRVATGLRAAYGSRLSATATAHGPAVDLVQWLGRADVLVRQWGGPPVAFPGMRLS